MDNNEQEIEFYGFSPQNFLNDLKAELIVALKKTDNEGSINVNFNNDFSTFEDICLKTIFKIDFPFERKISPLINERNFDEMDFIVKGFLEKTREYEEKKKMLDVYRKQQFFYEELARNIKKYDDALEDYDELTKYLSSCLHVQNKLQNDMHDNSFYEFLKSKELRNKIYSDEKADLERKGTMEDLEIWIKEIKK